MMISHELRFLHRLSKCAVVATLTLAAGAVSAAVLPRDTSNGRQMYQGASMTCLAANDFYAVHFTALQEGRHEGEQTDFIKYCREIPKPGKTYLTLDLLDRDARRMPVSLRVVEEDLGEDGRLAKEKRTLVETLPTVYKSGTAEIQANITEPGHYAVIAVFGENDGFISEDDRLRIPFSVGIASPNQPNRWPGAIFALVIAILLSVMAWRGYHGLRSRVPARAASNDGEQPVSARQMP